MQTRIESLLRYKGSTVYTAFPHSTVCNAVRQMNECGVGALVIIDGQGHLAGIFSERDVLRRVVAQALDPDTTRVRDVMTTDLIVISPDLTVEQTMSIMVQKRCRHIPVVEAGRLVGLVSSGDLTHWVTRDQAQAIRDLHHYIHGPLVADAGLGTQMTMPLG